VLIAAAIAAAIAQLQAGRAAAAALPSPRAKGVVPIQLAFMQF
jgi:hypothetical protein